MTKDERKAYDAKRRKNNKETFKAWRKAYRTNNREAVNASHARYRANNKETVKTRNSQYYIDNKAVRQAYDAAWCKLNPDKVAKNNSHRKRKLEQATPMWSEVEAIKLVYLKRNEYRKLYGILYEVDHIIPIDSDTVCGLHVLANLQLLDKSLNSSKTNTYQSDW